MIKMLRIGRIMPYALPIIVMGIVAVFYFVNPTMQHYPLRCIWNVITETQCPACGIQRAIYALVHGNFAEALSCNYFFVLSVPFAILVILSEWYNYHHKLDWLRAIIHNQYTLKTYVFLYFGWWILRNVCNVYTWQISYKKHWQLAMQNFTTK